MPDPTTVPLISLNDHPIKDAALWPVVSLEYSDSSAYAVNSHVIVNNHLYRCVTAIDSNGEEWTPAHWVQTTIDEELRRGIQIGLDALHVLAGEYDPTHTYLVGSYVMKDGSFYRCTTEIANGEEWEPLHWSEVTISNELISQKTEHDLLADIVAPDYDANQPYSKNSYVRKDGVLYRALVNVAGLELWNSANWERCTVDSEMGHSRTTDKFTQDSIAPEYNPSRTYSAGDLVMYGGKLYKCLTTVSVPEPWNSERWTLTSVANEVNLGDISSVFGFYIDDEGYLAQSITSDGFDPSTVDLDEVLGFYISVDGYISQRTSA